MFTANSGSGTTAVHTASDGARNHDNSADHQPPPTVEGTATAMSDMGVEEDDLSDGPIPVEARTTGSRTTNSVVVTSDLGSMASHVSGSRGIMGQAPRIVPSLPPEGYMGGLLPRPGLPPISQSFGQAAGMTSTQHSLPFQHGAGQGVAAYHSFHNAPFSSPSLSAPSTPPKFPGSQTSSNQRALLPPHMAYLPPQMTQPQQQVVVLLPSTAKIDRLQVSQVVDAVSSALQRTVEFKDLLMTVAPTPLVVLENAETIAGATTPAVAVEKKDQGVTVKTETVSVGVHAAQSAPRANEKCVSIETQTEDSEMLRELLEMTVDHLGDQSSNGDTVVWFDKNSLKQSTQTTIAPSPRSGSVSSTSSWWCNNPNPNPNPNPRVPSANRPSAQLTAADLWGSSTMNTGTESAWPEGLPLGSSSRSASQGPPPTVSNRTSAPSRAPSQPPTAASSASSSTLASSRLGARGLRPSSLLNTSAQLAPAPTPAAPTRTTRQDYYPAGPPRLLPNRPLISNPALPPVDPPEIHHPLTFVTPFRPANSGPAPYHVTLRNLRPTVTPRDLLHLARDLRSLVKIYFPPHAFRSFVGRAAVFFLGEESEAIEFSKWIQGQIQRGKLRVVYELTEADVREAEVRRGLPVGRWQTILAVTMFRPGGKKPARRAPSAGQGVVERIEGAVKEQIQNGEKEWAEQVEAAAVRNSDNDQDADADDDGEVDEGDWKQWEADLCRLFDDEHASGTEVDGVQEDEVPIEWVDDKEVAELAHSEAGPKGVSTTRVDQSAREPSVVRNFDRMWQATGPN